MRRWPLTVYLKVLLSAMFLLCPLVRQLMSTLQFESVFRELIMRM